MEIIVKGRRTDVNDRFRRHVDNKLARIERLDQKVMRVDVEVSKERNPRQADRRERVELTIHSRGPVIRAEAAAEDRYGALDLALDKLESRLRRSSDRRKVHHGSRSPAKLARLDTLPEADGAPAAAMVEPVGGVLIEPVPGPLYEPPRQRQDKAAAEEDGHLVPIPMEGDCPVVVREKSHQADPMTIDQALLEMELVGHDFYLFRDKESGRPSVVYRRRGWDYGVIRLVEE